jgi:RND family efflux transporter MFP subunit
MQPTQTLPPESETRRHAADHDHDEVDLNVPEPRPVWVVVAGVVAVLVLGALLVVGLIPRHRQEKELHADVLAADAPVPVNTARPRRAPAVLELNLPGTLRPWKEVSMYARTSGYLKKYHVDISNRVEEGQLLAEIDTPEIEQELRQAQAALVQTRAAVAKATADRDLARVTSERYQQLVKSNHVSQQDADEKQGALNAAESTLASANANVIAAEANVQRFTELQQFQEMHAPFSGVVTGRGYDIGSLIIANPQATDVRPMYKIAQNDVLRAFVNVPQSSALAIRKGMEVKVTAKERPGRVFKGVVMGTTNYLDPTSRSLMTEVKVPNATEPGGEFALLPGMFVSVSFAVTRDTPPLVIPAPALVTSAEGTQVVVAADGAARFRPVTLGQDYGSEIEIVEGLSGDEEVIANPGERIAEGTSVIVNPAEPHHAAAPAKEPDKTAQPKVAKAVAR